MRKILGEGSKIFVALFVAATLLCGCDKGYEDNDDQSDDIVSFLTTSHDPILISESDIKSSLEDDPNFYTEFGGYAYVYIDDYYNIERQSKTQISNNSRVTLTFRLYPFEGSAISDSTLPTYTNDPTYEELYIEDGLNTTYWSFLPLEFVVGESDVLYSIQSGLIGCREGDDVEIYMTSNMAYGDNVIGVMEQYSSLVIFCSIDSVEN